MTTTTTTTKPEFSDEPGTARDVAQIYELYHKAKIVEVSSAEDSKGAFLLVPKGMEALSVKRYIDEYRTEPERRKGKALHRELASFIAHVNRFKDDHSAIFADRNPAQPLLVALLDYHQRGAEGAPRFGEHRSVYEPALSEEWRAWAASNGHQMAQGDFAQFIEDRIGDVIQPGVANDDPQLANFVTLVGGSFASPSKLIEISRSMAVNVDERIKQAVNLSSGTISVQYETVHGDGRGNPLEVPNLFLIAIPVFRSGQLYRIPVRLRYRVNGGRLQWSYQLYRADKTFDHAFQEICDGAAAQTSLPLFVGTPEA